MSVPSIRRQWAVGIVAGAIALAALVAGSAWGHVTSRTLDPRLVAWISAGVLVVCGGLATTRVAHALSRSIALGPVPAAQAAVRILAGAAGYLVVVFGVLAVLSVPIEKILVGAGLAGVVLGIAAQQSLGNVFAGLVIILARPFGIGDHIRVRSGALGGVFDAWVREISLTYVTVELDTGQMKIPNSAMLSAGVGRVPPGTPLPVAAPVAPPASPSSLAPGASGTATPPPGPGAAPPAPEARRP
jgi:small-conductance mechanosensitive channel